MATLLVRLWLRPAYIQFAPVFNLLSTCFVSGFFESRVLGQRPSRILGALHLAIKPRQLVVRPASDLTGIVRMRALLECLNGFFITPKRGQSAT